MNPEGVEKKKEPLTPEVEKMLNQALEDMLHVGKPNKHAYPQFTQSKPYGIIKTHHLGKLNPKLVIPTNVTAQLWLQNKINWLLDGHDIARKTHDEQLAKTIRKLLRKEGYYISKHGKDPVNFKDPKWWSSPISKKP